MTTLISQETRADRDKAQTLTAFAALHAYKNGGDADPEDVFREFTKAFGSELGSPALRPLLDHVDAAFEAGDPLAISDAIQHLAEKYLGTTLGSGISLERVGRALTIALWVTRFLDAFGEIEYEPECPWTAPLCAPEAAPQPVVVEAFLTPIFLEWLDPAVEGPLRAAVSRGTRASWLLVAATIRQRLEYSRCLDDLTRQLVILWTFERGLIECREA